MSVVIDSSITLAWVYSDETTHAVREVFQRVGKTGAWVPQLWRLEIANVLEMGVRGKRHDEDFREATLADLSRLLIQVDTDTEREAWSATLKLAIRHQLTTYDAAYLELALRRDLPLATLDTDLRRAASAEKTRLLG